MEIVSHGHTTPQEYLAFERAAATKHEYYEGQVRSMAGTSMAHNFIVANVVGEVRSILKGNRCNILPSDMRICTPSESAYMYPDAVIVCGEPEMADNRCDTLKNPVVIFEVLSPSTKQHDRRKKFHFYQQIPSFKEYILIDSTEFFVEINHRKDDGSWEVEVNADPGSHLFISSIRKGIPMEEIYRNIVFKQREALPGT